MAPNIPISMATGGLFDFLNLHAGIKRTLAFGSLACMHVHFFSLFTLREHQNLLHIFSVVTLSRSTEDSHALRIAP